jgi:hypothetical protein
MARRKVFISHIASSPADVLWVKALRNTLASNGLDVFEQRMDEPSLPLETVGEALRESDILVLVMTEATVNAPEFMFELGVAIGGDKLIYSIVPSEASVDALILPLQQQAIVKSTPGLTAETLLTRLPRSRAA